MKRKITSGALVVAILCCLPLISHSGFLDSATGTTGAQFLRICPGARPAALGGAFTAVTDDANAVAYNPASISFMPHQLCLILVQ